MFMQDWDSGSHGFWLDSGTPWAFSFFIIDKSRTYFFLGATNIEGDTITLQLGLN